MKYKIVLFSFLILHFAVAFTQNFSNKGNDFWITYPVHINGLSSIMGIYITSDVNASGMVIINGESISFTVIANTVTEKFIGSTSAADASNSYVYLSQTDGIKTGAAIHIVSDNPVVVYAHIIHSERSGATLVLPSNVWGREYVVPSYASHASSSGEKLWGYGTITIVAEEPGTTVQITPTIASSDGARVAGTAYSITLANPGDVYQVQFTQGADISGTKVQSISTGSGCKKIAVFSSTTWSAFGCIDANSGDNLYQQLFPTGAWGKSFLTAPAKTRTSDIFRVFVSDPSAIVTKTENGITAPLTGLISNSYYEFTTGNPTFIQSNKTASVVQYFTTMTCQNGATAGDPEMTVINPIEQTINNITVFSAHQNVINAKFPGQSNITNCYLNIIIKTSAAGSFKINNASPNGLFTSIPGTSYSYLQEDVTSRSLTNPVQNLKADSNFIAIAYGFGNVESYGYNAGTNVIDLTQGIIIKNLYATTASQATCAGIPVSFDSKFSYQPTSITWDFGNNTNITPNSIISFNNPNFDSTFIDNNSGKTIYVYKLPGTYTFKATGKYPVKVTANNPTSDGCSGIQIIKYTVQVYSPPATNFKLVSSGCVTDSLHFTDLTNPVTGAITKWIWDFSDQTTDSVQNPVKKYGVGGSYTVHLRTVTDIGCFGDTTKTVALSALPDIKFAIKDSSTCVNALVKFNDYSTITSGMGIIKSWIWSYGDGTGDTVLNNASRTHIYKQMGKDTVYLNLVTNTGCSETLAHYINIYPNPVPGFITPEVCLTDVAQFINTSSIADSSQSQFEYAWNFNSGSPSVAQGPAPLTSTLKNPFVQYNSPDNYKVSLKVSSKDGCSDSLQKPFMVNGSAPKANFMVQQASLCSNDSVRIKDLSTVNFGNITTVEIYWDNLQSSKEVDSFPTSGAIAGTGKTYSHLYPNDQQLVKKHYIQFFAYSGLSCVSSMLDSVTLNQSPLVQFNTLPGICNDTTSRQITQALETKNVPLASILFTGAGVSASGLFNPQSVFPSTYSIKYLVTSVAGCKDSATQPITVWPSPTAKWEISTPVCERNPITFKDASLANFGNITNWYWDFGDGTTSIQSAATPFTKTYTTSDTYTASLRVMTDSGCRSFYNIQPIHIHYLPVVNFVLPMKICLPKDGKGKFTDSSSITDNSQQYFSYLWNFGDVNDPSASTLQNPIHQYTALGSYRVQLKVTSKDGCSDSLSQLLTQLYPQPKADFSASSTKVCVNDAITFTDLSNGITGNINSWMWNLAEGYSSSTQNTSRTFKDSGTFTISLGIYNQQGCTDTALKEVTVYPYPKLILGPGRIILQGGMISIIPQYSYGTNLQYLWMPSTYLNSDTAAHPQASPPEDIQYKLDLTGIGNCVVYDSVTITVLKMPVIPNAFSPNGDGINDTWTIPYLNSYPGCTVDVYDRNGQVVFHSIGYSTNWDGRNKGVLLPIGTYYYIINPKNGRQIMSGSVTIIR